MKKKYERLQMLLDIIKEKTSISVKELAGYLDVSEMTVRRDVEVLKESGQVSTLYGAIVYTPPQTTPHISDNYHLHDAVITHHSEKERIGAFAASLVEEEDILIIDTGSTTEALARNLDPEVNITVLCYNHNILNTLLEKNGVDPIFSGGYYHANTQMFESKEGISLIESTRANKVFISAAGIHQKLGITCANSYEIATKKAIGNSGVEKILLADSSKFSVVKSAYFAELNEFDQLVTDSGISQEWIDYITDLDITLHIV